MFIAIARAMAGENTDIVENRELYEIFLSLRLDMLRNYEKPWTTEDLCRRANLEKSQFFACYQKFFQVPLMQTFSPSAWKSQESAHK